MSTWLIEAFAAAALTRAFWGVTLMALPVWAVLLFAPRGKLARKLSRQPFWIPSVYGIVLLFLYFQAWEVGLPSLPGGTSYSDSKAFLVHPLILLTVWCKLQILQLFAGLCIHREALRLKTVAPAELVLTWFFGPLGLLVFSLRSFFHGGLKK